MQQVCKIVATYVRTSIILCILTYVATPYYTLITSLLCYVAVNKNCAQSILHTSLHEYSFRKTVLLRYI